VATLKTQETDASVDDFIDAVVSERRRTDCRAVVEMMTGIVGEPARLWGTSIIGFGRYRYRYASGRTGEWPLCGVSPRKTSLTLYIMTGLDSHDDLMERLGKHKTGRSCLYVNKLEDIDTTVLRELITRSVAAMRERYPAD